jgi:Rne/Rng family ribonuclease
MTVRLVVEATGFGVRGALLDGDRLVELADADAGGEGVADGLFLARVTGVDQHLNAAFLDCGLPEAGFLAAKDARHAAGSEERLPIGRLVREGQRLIVQGVREAADGKGARFTTDLRLLGFHLLLRPHADTPAVSARLRGRLRDDLLDRALRLFKGQGVTLRRLAVEATDEVLLAEAERLRGRWATLQKAVAGGAATGRLAGDEHPLERLLRGMAEQGIERLELADPALQARARTLVGADGPAILRLDRDRGAFEQAGVAAEIERALAVEVPLGKGGRLLIEPTAACTAIDVDGQGRAALDLDLEAAAEIGRQARLRNLGGTLVIDFVDLPTKPQRQRLEEALRKAFGGDPATVQIYPMSPLGIVQISRARRGQSLARLLARPCPACGGDGQAPSLRAVAERLLAELRALPQPAVRVVAASDLAHYLQGEAAWAWRPVAAAGARLVTERGLAAGTYRLERSTG